MKGVIDKANTKKEVENLDKLMTAMSHGSYSSVCSSGSLQAQERDEVERSVAKGTWKLSKYQEREVGSVISLYENGHFLKVIQKEDCYIPSSMLCLAVAIDSSKIDISLITVGSLNRVFVASIVSTRWDG